MGDWVAQEPSTPSVSPENLWMRRGVSTTKEVERKEKKKYFLTTAQVQSCWMGLDSKVGKAGRFDVRLIARFTAMTTLRTPWPWQKYCLNHCARTSCSLRIVTRCRFTNWRISCQRSGRNVHFLSMNLISFRRSRGICFGYGFPGAGDGQHR